MQFLLHIKMQKLPFFEKKTFCIMRMKRGMDMLKEAIQTNDAPKAIGPYSVAINTDGFIFLSGQIPVDPKTGEIAETIEEQTKQV